MVRGFVLCVIMHSLVFRPNELQLSTRSSLVLLSNFPWPKSLTYVFARGLAYQPSVALVVVTLYQLYYVALDPIAGVSLPSPGKPASITFSFPSPAINLTHRPNTCSPCCLFPSTAWL
jgi:hypothetical protein